MPQRFRAQIAPREKREKRNRPSSADRKCPSRNPAPEGARWAAARIFGTGKRERGTFPTPGIPLRAMAPVFGTGAGNSGPGDPAHVTGTRVTRPRFGRETRSTGYSSDIPGRCGHLYAPPDLPTAAHYRDENSLNSGHPRGPVWRPRGHPACGDPYPRRGRGPCLVGGFRNQWGIRPGVSPIPPYRDPIEMENIPIRGQFRRARGKPGDPSAAFCGKHSHDRPEPTGGATVVSGECMGHSARSLLKYTPHFPPSPANFWPRVQGAAIWVLAAYPHRNKLRGRHRGGRG